MSPLAVSPILRPLLLAAAVAPGCSPRAVTTDDVGEAEACEDVATWTAEAAGAETALLEAVNRARLLGAMCGEDYMPPQLELELVPELRCAARIHAKDLSRTGELTHEGSDGRSTLERVAEAGYPDFPRHELLAADYLLAQEVVDAWMAEPDHCRAILDGDIEHAGPGAHEQADGSRIAWVLVTGEPRME
jgi:uncharacterized protein YkwD